MKKIWIAAAIFLCFWMHGGRAEAAYVTGADLTRYCRSGESDNILSCIHYVAGIIDYHIMMQSLGTEPTVDFCLPESLPIESAAFTVMKYLEKSSQHDSFIAASAVLMALQEAYPCRAPAVKKKKKKSGK